MIELSLALTAGVLGSSHCLGMCGPFALTLGTSAGTSKANLLRQLSYSMGRIFTYASLGAIVGFGGQEITKQFSGDTIFYIPALLSVIAGVFLLYQGLRGAGYLKRRMVTGSSAFCLAGSSAKSILTVPGYLAPFLAGVMTGFLPCGLLYGMITLAASTGTLAYGALVMMVFGLGTVPMMVAAGWGGSLLGLATRQKLFKAAAWCVIVTGGLTIVRGVWFLAPSSEDADATCPFCVSETSR